MASLAKQPTVAEKRPLEKIGRTFLYTLSFSHALMNATLAILIRVHAQISFASNLHKFSTCLC